MVITVKRNLPGQLFKCLLAGMIICFVCNNLVCANFQVNDKNKCKHHECYVWLKYKLYSALLDPALGCCNLYHPHLGISWALVSQ